MLSKDKAGSFLTVERFGAFAGLCDGNDRPFAVSITHTKILPAAKTYGIISKIDNVTF